MTTEKQQQPTTREALVGLVIALPGLTCLGGFAWFVYGWFAEDGHAIVLGLTAGIVGGFICSLAIKLKERYGWGDDQC